MGLFEDTAPEPVAPESPIKHKIQPDEFDGITVDTKYIPSSALLTWVEGYNWTVDYYSQFLGADSEPAPQAIDRSPIYQQYRLIKQMDLKVTTPINFSQDPTIMTMQVTGSAITYPFLKPNFGDMFIAGIGDGRLGVFTVSQAPSRATILRDSVYNIEYTMVAELTAERKADLDRKVQETYHYSQASLISGCGPFVTGPEQARANKFSAAFKELLARYLTDFYSNEFRTLLVPDQLERTYDHWVVTSCLTMFESFTDARIRMVREMNINGDLIMKQPNLWDAVLARDAKAMYGICERAHLISTAYFGGRPVMQGLRYTGIKRLVFPIDAPTDVDSQYKGTDRARPVGLPFREGRPRRPEPGLYVPQAARDALWFQPTPMMAEVPPWRLPPDIHPVIIDDYYVMSGSFYRNHKPGQSKLELLLWQALNREAINQEQLEWVVDSAKQWDNLERYYYHPVLFMLLKAVGMR